MKFIFPWLALLLLVHCGPRDDESLLGDGSGGGFDLKGGIIKVTAAEQKLPSCDKGSDPTWDTVRLFNELSFMFDKVHDLQVVVGKGARNCVKVSDQKAVEIVLQDAPQSQNFAGSGAFYFVTELQLMSLADFLADKDLLEKSAEGMGMTVEALTNFLQASPQRNEITLTYLSKGSESKKEDGETSESDFSLSPGIVITQETMEEKLPSCIDEKDPTWKNLQLASDYLEQPEDDFANLKVVLGFGARNCYKVSESQTVQLQIETEAGSKNYKTLNQHYKITKLQMMHTSTLLAKTQDLEALGQGSLLGLEKIKEQLTSPEAPEVVTLSFVEPSEAIQGGVSPVLVFDKVGSMASKCEKKWDVFRVFPEFQDKVQKALHDQTLRAVINKGDYNCLEVGSEIVFAFKNSAGKFEEDTRKLKVKSIVVRDKSQFLSDPILSDLVSAEMGMSLQDFTSLLNDYDKDKVNVSRFEWLEAQ